MNDKCFDIGTIQAFLDGELAADVLEGVSLHVASCDDCAVFLAEAEEESAIAFSALDREFNTLVPTQRLWTKINDSIQKEEKTFWQTVAAFFSNQTTVAFAGMLIVFSIFLAMINLESSDNALDVTKNIPSDQSLAVPTVDLGIPVLPIKQDSLLAQNNKKTDIEKAALIASNKTDYSIIKTTFVKKEISPPRIVNSPKAKPEVSSPAPSENVPGEDSYIRTIATLEKTVDSRKDEVLNYSARFAFERDLAVNDDAIKKMKAEVRKNPKDEAAKEILRASYQNKIDLLNSVADKTELMASLK